MRKLLKKSLALVLAGILLLGASAVPGIDFSTTAFADAGGNDAGENISWSFTEATGSFVITGIGEMTERMYYDTAPWHNYRPYIKSVFISAGVTSICSDVFRDCTSLERVEFAAGSRLTSISNYAFYGCKSLPSITLPDGLTRVGNAAFEDCESLTSITLPEGVTGIGWSAFSGCSKLASITLPGGIAEIGTDAFENTAYYNNQSNWENDALYIGEYLIEVKDTFSGEYEIKNGTKIIASGAFGECKGLTGVTIPASVTSINLNAFISCESLTGVIIPTSVKSIGGSAFQNCKSLTGVIIPASVTYMDALIFNACENLESVVFAEGSQITKIDGHTFRSCRSLTSIVIPDGVTSIVGYAFAGCSALKQIHIPASVTDIDALAFYNCDDDLYICSQTDTCTAKSYADDNSIGFCVCAEPHCPFCFAETIAADAAVPATCTETGLTEGSHCSACNEIIVAQETVNATGHTEVVDTPAAPAACTAAGTTKGSHCSVCSDILATPTDVPATGHTEVVDTPAAPATCTAAGTTRGSHCSVCNEVLSTAAAIPAAGHSFGKWESNGDAGFFKDGTMTSTCTACGESKTVTDEGSSTLSRIFSWFFTTLAYLAATVGSLFILIFNKLVE